MKGFTLAETMIAIGICALVMSAIAVERRSAGMWSATAANAAGVTTPTP